MWSQLFTFLVASLYFVSAQTGINTGTSYYALRFPDAGQASVTLPEAMSEDLPHSFTFEAWVMLPSEVNGKKVTSADGLYKTIVSRYAVRPDGTYHNRYADFNFQIQKSGEINFFMGNGLSPSFYGLIITPGTLTAGRWTHLAFSVHTADGKFNPDYGTVYVDGVAFNSTWKSGDRQLREDVPIHIGAYLNQDGDVKWWRGYMDEIRFWAGYRNQEQIKATMNVDVSPKDTNLLAYYKCDSGAVLVDATSRYDGQFVSGAGSVKYELSGVKLGVQVAVGRQGSIDITLPGVGTSPFTFVIASLPDSMIGRLISGGNVIFQDNLPFSLPSNVVTFQAGNVEGETTTFTYYGKNSAGQDNSTTVWVAVDQNACNPDACGVCNGDNSTCTCLDIPYKGYSYEDLEKILLLYEIEQTLDLLNQVEVQLDQAMDAVDATDSNFGGALNNIQEFNEVCLTDFHDYMGGFLDDLSQMD